MGGRRSSGTRKCCPSVRAALFCGSIGQSAMEYVMITGFVMLILFGILVVAYSQTAAFSRDVSQSQVQKVGNEIADGANAVYYAGPPAKKTVTLYFPDLINNITIANQSITFNMQSEGGHYEYSVSAATNMTGALRPFAGLHMITLRAQAGIVNITDG